jgi:hypothetical protein
MWVLAKRERVGLVRHCPCRNAYWRCVRTSSVTAHHHQAVESEGGIKGMTGFIELVNQKTSIYLVLQSKDLFVTCALGGSSLQAFTRGLGDE